MMGVTERRAPAMAAAAAPDSAQALFPVRPYFKFKRWIDVAGCCAIATLLLPILLVAGVLVLFDVGRPLLFWQERSGWKGRSFLIYKFRTLRAPFTADGQAAPTDRQPSAIGQFLRGTRIDELPQLLNVLLGDMSLIGPRPLLPEDQPSNPLLRLSIRPGLTGWAQVNGGKLVSKEEKEKLDEWYVRNATFWVDLMIVLMTIKMMMSQSPQESQADAQQIQLKRLSPMVTTTEPDRAALVAPAVRTLSAGGRR
jgi:lipopolysaccharide/colanic/teichoic acid biosynthesis glycosyltransferase